MKIMNPQNIYFKSFDDDILLSKQIKTIKTMENNRINNDETKTLEAMTLLRQNILCQK